MKPLFLLLLLAPFVSFSQGKLPVDDAGKIVYEEIVVLDSVSSNDLYNRAITWFIDNFKSPQDAIKMKVPETGTILANGLISIEWPLLVGKKSDAYLSFRIEINCKDGRYKYKFSNLAYFDKDYGLHPEYITGIQKSNNKKSQLARESINNGILEVINGLKRAMSSNDSW